MASGSGRTPRWSGFGLVVGIATLGCAACAPVRSALRPYQEKPVGTPRAGAANATATATGVIAAHPSEPSHTIYLVGSQEQADALAATLAPIGALAPGTFVTIVVLPDHAPFNPQPPDYVPPVSFTVIDLRP